MKSLVNALIRIVAASTFGAVLYRGASLVRELTLRFGSIAKARSLFPGARGLSLDLRCDIKYPANVVMGQNVTIGADCQIGAMAQVTLGDLVRISRGVMIETATLDRSGPLPYKHVARPITIGRGVWLGAHAVILGGVQIGDHAVIGAGAIVTRDVPDGAIVVNVAPRQLAQPASIQSPTSPS